jgi:thiamine pyrophosphokinase
MACLIIFANGLLPGLEAARQLIHPGDVLWAADGGTRLALALGFLPAVVIGDLDSLLPDERLLLERGGSEIRLFPPAKDETDLELALKYAQQGEYRDILILGGLGGRLDQTLGNLALLSDPSLSGCNIRFDDGIEEAFFVRRRCEIHGEPGEVVSLIPWGGQVTGINTEGLHWPLHGAVLYPEKTRGISNILTAETASISLETGLLLVAHLRST